MKGDFTRDSFNEARQYSAVLLQQGRVQLDADWNEAASIENRRAERSARDLVGACGSPNDGFKILGRAILDALDSASGWTGVGATAEVCSDHLDRLRGTASLRVAGTSEVSASLRGVLNLSLPGETLVFAVKSAAAPPAARATHDTGFSLFVVDGANRRATWAVAPLTPQTLGVWQVYACTVASASLAAGMRLDDVRAIGFSGLRTNWIYHFDSIQREFPPVLVPVDQLLGVEPLDHVRGWSLPPTSTGGISPDGPAFEGRPTLELTGPGDAFHSFGEPRSVRALTRVVTITNPIGIPSFFFSTAAGTKIRLTSVSRTTSGIWTRTEGDVPSDPNIDQVIGYGFEIGSGSTLNVARVDAVVGSAATFFILGGSSNAPGRLYVDGIACQKEDLDTYYSQRQYPDALPLTPADNRVDLVYADVWQRHVTSIEDPEIREVALGGLDTCTRIQTVAQVKVLKGAVDATSTPLNCANMPSELARLLGLLRKTGTSTLSTVVAPPAQPDALCEIAPDSDFLGLDNRLYRVEVADPIATGQPPRFKWSRDNGSIAVAVIEDVAPVTGTTPQVVHVERLGRDRATAFVVNDWVEIGDDISDLADARYGADGIPLRRTGELRQVADLDPDANTLTLNAPLIHSYTVARHARVRKWDGVRDIVTATDIDLGDGVQIRFGGTAAAFANGDYWQFTARGLTGQVERLDDAPPPGIVHHYCPLALIKWKATTSGSFQIVDYADCRPLFPGATAIQATDVDYDDACCGLNGDMQSLATAMGDPIAGGVTTVQQAIDALCARESAFLTLRYVSGDGQHGRPGETDGLPAPLRVAVENVLGEPRANVPVVFTVIQPGALEVATASGVRPHATPRSGVFMTQITVFTDSQGEVAVDWQLGAQVGLNLVRASLDTPQAGQPEVLFNAIGVVVAASGLCTITVGDGNVSHGQFDGFRGIVQALSAARAQGGGTICVLRGTYVVTDSITVDSAMNMSIEGNRQETLLVSKAILPFDFVNCHGIELRNLRFLTENPRGADDAPRGIVQFTRCTGVVVEDCLIKSLGRADARGTVACVLVIGRPVSIPPPILPPPPPPPPPPTPVPADPRDRLPRYTPPSVPAVVDPMRVRIQRSHFVAQGAGPMAGIVVIDTIAAQIAENLVQMSVDLGGYGVDIDADSDWCVVTDNTIRGFVESLQSVTRSALSGIHVGSGCDNVTVRGNRIFGGAGHGVALGSVEPDTDPTRRKSRGGMLDLRIEANHIAQMGAGGVGMLTFAADVPDPPSSAAANIPVTNGLLVCANVIEHCGFNQGSAAFIQQPGGAVTAFRLAGGIAVFIGDEMRLLDNRLTDNGTVMDAAGNLIAAPHPVCALLVAFAGPGLTIARNFARGNMSPNTTDPGMRGVASGIFWSAITPRADVMTVQVDGNDIDNLASPPGGAALIALSVKNGGATQIVNNAFAGWVEAERGSVDVRVGNELQFNNNRVTSRVSGNAMDACRLDAQHVTLTGNHFLTLAQLARRSHVYVPCRSATASTNHVLETALDTIPSLRIESFDPSAAGAAVGNITTNGVVVATANSADVANLQGVLA